MSVEIYVHGVCIGPQTSDFKKNPETACFILKSCLQRPDTQRKTRSHKFQLYPIASMHLRDTMEIKSDRTTVPDSLPRGAVFCDSAQSADAIEPSRYGETEAASTSRAHSQAHCPSCRTELVRRVARRGLLDRLASNLFIYPFRCQICSCRFRKMRWGVHYSKAPIDRREHERVTVQMPASIPRVSADETFIVRDISMGGCGIEMPLPPDTGVIVALQLFPDGVHQPPIRVEAAMVQSSRERFMGVEFLRIAPEHRARLSQLVWKKLVDARAPHGARTKTLSLHITDAPIEHS